MARINNLDLTIKLIDDSFLDENGKVKDDLKFNINNPAFKIHNSKFIGKPEDKFETMLFLPEGEGRKGEGGLRTKGYFKFSYKLVQGSRFKVQGCEDLNILEHGTSNVQQPLWYLCDLDGNPIEAAPADIQTEISKFISQQSNTVEAVSSCSSRSAIPEYRSPNIDSRLPTPDHRSPRSPVTHHLSPVTNHKSQLPSQLPITKLPLITVITVVCNGEKTLERTIQSVINQTYPNVEYIIIDGGSTDNTLDIIRMYEDYIDYWVSEKDRGIYDAMNKGVYISLGSWLLFLGSDDLLISENVFSIILKDMRFNADFIYGNSLIKEICKLYDGKFSSYKLCLKNICHQAILYNISRFKRNGLFNHRYKLWADHEFNMRIWKTSYKKFINIPISIYSINGMSGHAVDECFMKDYFKLIKVHMGIVIFILLKVRRFIVYLLDTLKLKRKLKKVFKR